MKRPLTFRPIDSRRVRAVLAAPPSRVLRSLSGRLLTRDALARAGLSDHEIRLIGGFRGLDPRQQETLLALVARAVIQRVEDARLADCHIPDMTQRAHD